MTLAPILPAWLPKLADRRLFLRALLLAALIIAVDQLSKHWILAGLQLQVGDRLAVTPFFNLVLTFNRGVTFGLFYHHSDLMPYLLSAVAILICGGLLLWLARTNDAFVGTALGLIIGGALGNVIDRLRYGGVADFLDFHWGGWHWPAFNLADSAIVIGVGLLLVDGLFRQRREG